MTDETDTAKTKPDGTEAKGLPDSGRDRTEAVLEKALPGEHQRKVQPSTPETRRPLAKPRPQA